MKNSLILPSHISCPVLSSLSPPPSRFATPFSLASLPFSLGPYSSSPSGVGLINCHLSLQQDSFTTSPLCLPRLPQPVTEAEGRMVTDLQGTHESRCLVLSTPKRFQPTNTLRECQPHPHWKHCTPEHQRIAFAVFFILNLPFHFCSPPNFLLSFTPALKSLTVVIQDQAWLSIPNPLTSKSQDKYFNLPWPGTLWPSNWAHDLKVYVFISVQLVYHFSWLSNPN